jgi:sugar O-acyltransferase (sialic acid O-acetyltransferase NeuD family)
MGLVIFGASNILSDLVDCAQANGLPVECIVLHQPEPADPRSIPLAERVARMAAYGPAPAIIPIDEFTPVAGLAYLLGPTTPERAVLAREAERRFGISFTTLVHPTAHVSPMTRLAPGCFVGAGSVIGPMTTLGRHVFVNRGVTIGHDTEIGEFSRIQPGANVGGLTRIGSGVTVGMGATVLERLVVGDGVFVGAGAVVTADVEPRVLVVGVPARVKKVLD